MDHEHSKSRLTHSRDHSAHAKSDYEPTHEAYPAGDESSATDRQVLRAARRATRQRRALKVAFWGLIPLLLVWLAPAIIAHTSLRQTLVDRATTSLNGRVSLGSASFGWLSPVKLYDVQLRDSEGESVATVKSVHTQRSLLGLLLNRREPGEITVEQPRVRLVLRRDGSNLEDILAPLLEGPSSNESIPVSLMVHGGEVELVDAETDRAWTLGAFDSEIAILGGGGPVEVSVRGELSSDSSNGALNASLQWEPGEGLGTGQLTIQADAFPLDALNTPVQRFAGTIVGPLNGEGVAKIDGKYAWSESGSPNRRGSGRKKSNSSSLSHTLAIEELSVRDLALSASEWLGQDTLRIPEVKIRGSVEQSGDSVEFRGLSVASEIATVEARGRLSLAALVGEGGLSTWLDTLQRDDALLHAELDLARLAAIFPETLRIREGTEITSGKITATFNSRVEREKRVWQGEIESTNLTATNQGRRVSWNQPIQISLSASQGTEGPVIDKLQCTSSFLRAETQGTVADGRLVLEGDLDRLSQELAQFIDLGSTRLAGKMGASVNWTVASRNRATVHGELGMEQLEIVLGNARPWREPSLDILFDAQATIADASLAVIHSATFKVTAGDDTLDVELTESVQSPGATSAWPVAARLRGDLARWLPRVQSFLPLAGWDLAGNADVRLAGRWEANRCAVSEGKLQFRDLTVVGAGLFLNEPQVEIELTGTWDGNQRRLEAPSATFASSALAFRADQVVWDMSESAPSLSANVGLRGDLARLTGWLQDPRQPLEWQLAGMSTGQVRLSHASGATTAQWALEFDNLTYASVADTTSAGVGRITATAPALQPKWLEPKLKFSGEGELDLAQRSFKIGQSRVTGDGLEVSLAGLVQDWSERCNVSLEGEMGYDLSRLVTRLRGQLGPSLQLDGRDVRPFALRGPLRNLQLTTTAPIRQTGSSVSAESPAATWPPLALDGQAALRWNSAILYGLPIGPGEIDARLKEGVLQFKPLDVEVAQGRLRLAPRIHWDQPEPVVVVESGPALEKVTLSPELCGTWLKYIVPVLADVTEAQGQFSLSLNDTAVVPLDRPEDGEVRGQIDIHGVQVGPSPMTRELISLAQTIKAIADNKAAPDPPGTKAWLQLPEQPIPFHWRQRRVHHERLVVTMKDVSIVTGGSVGVDQSVNLLAQIPIRDEWIASNRYLTSLQGQSIQVPITGTLSQPKVDRRVLQNLASQTITNSANRVIEQELNRGLDRLLRPRAPGATPPPQPQPQPR